MMPSGRGLTEPIVVLVLRQLANEFGATGAQADKDVLDGVGCPPREVLVSLARRERPIGDPAYDHIKECSPCYVEGRAIQEADARRRILTWAAAAVLAVAAGTGVRILTKGSGPVEVEIQAQLDLRPYAITRGESQTTERRSLQLPRGVCC
jgi:hypothetical protein